MTPKKLTDRFIRTVNVGEAGGERVQIRDIQTPGLELRVSSRGIKTFSVLYRLHGRRVRQTLGDFPALGLAEARQLAGEAKLKAKRGEDPQADVRALAGAATVAELLDEYEREKASTLKSGAEVMRALRCDLKPWLKRRVPEILRRDLVLVVDAARKRAPVQANRLRSYVVGVWRFGCDRGLIEVSPFEGMSAAAPETPRARTLTDDELRWLWNLPNRGAAASALRLVSVTGCRPGEAAGARWGEIDLEAALWTVPASRMKSGDEHAFPLTPMAVALLDEQSGNQDALSPVFAGRIRGSPIRRDALSHWLRRGDQTFNPHDIRRTVRTRLADLGVADEIAERVLGHKVGERVQQTYNRHHYLDERRSALEAWASALAEITGTESLSTGDVGA